MFYRVLSSYQTSPHLSSHVYVFAAGAPSDTLPPSSPKFVHWFY
ncbi:unnamed protein product [Rhodiola kirilowii]